MNTLEAAVGRELHTHAGREPAMNVWDNKANSFHDIKTGLASGEIDWKDALSTGTKLLFSKDPAKTKLGMHIHRLGMWNDPGLATTWVDQNAPALAHHDHARIRHSNVWNLRTAAWQDPSLGEQVLDYAQAGLRDVDQGVQRASLWAMGDVARLRPELFDKALPPLQEFLKENPGESRDLFALERFFRSQQLTYGEDHRFRSSVQDIVSRSDGYPGLRLRAARMLGEEVDTRALSKDREIVREKLMKATEGTPAQELLAAGQYGVVFEAAAHRFADADTVKEGMTQLKVLRYLTWVGGELEQPFEIVGKTLPDKRDGDLARSASVFLTDCTLRQPTELATPAAQAVGGFFEHSDIDGSQIVVSLTLDPVRDGEQAARLALAKKLPDLHKLAANHSVNVALGDH